MSARRYPPAEQRFAAGMDKRGADECWPWTKSRIRTGYGVMSIGGKNTGTHRIAYTMANCPIPEGMCVLHRCDNPPCCNPRHLFLGTQVDNIADRDAKGRQRSAVGEASPKAVLTEQQVMEIWSSEGYAGDIAKKHGVTNGTVINIRLGYTWSHLTGGPADYKRLPPRRTTMPSPETIAEIRRRRQAGESIRSVARSMGIDKTAAWKYGKTEV